MTFKEVEFSRSIFKLGLTNNYKIIVNFYKHGQWVFRPIGLMASKIVKHPRTLGLCKSEKHSPLRLHTFLLCRHLQLFCIRPCPVWSLTNNTITKLSKSVICCLPSGNIQPLVLPPSGQGGQS